MLYYTIIGKTADLSNVQQTFTNTLHKEGTAQTVIPKTYKWLFELSIPLSFWEVEWQEKTLREHKYCILFGNQGLSQPLQPRIQVLNLLKL